MVSTRLVCSGLIPHPLWCVETFVLSAGCRAQNPAPRKLQLNLSERQDRALKVYLFWMLTPWPRWHNPALVSSPLADVEMSRILQTEGYCTLREGANKEREQTNSSIWASLCPVDLLREMFLHYHGEKQRD